MSVYIGSDKNRLISAVDSIVKQTLKPHQIILICDGCGSKIFESILFPKFYDFKDLFRILTYDDNKGPGFARHFGILHATTEYVAIMDDDDYSHSNRLELQFNFMEANPDISVCGAQIIEKRPKESLRIVPLAPEDVRSVARYKSPVNNVTAFIRRDDYLKVKGYPSTRSSEDYCLWAQFLAKGMHIANLEHVLVDVNFDSGAINRRQGYEHFRNDKMTQDVLLAGGLISKCRYFSNLFVYYIFRMAPQSAKSFLYRKVLRKDGS